MPPPRPHDHLRLLKDEPAALRPWALALLVAAVIGLAWGIAEWRVQAVLGKWEAAQQDSVAVPTVRIDCVDWQGRSFSVDVPLLPDDAARVARTIEQGIAPPYQPACNVQ